MTKRSWIFSARAAALRLGLPSSASCLAERRVLATSPYSLPRSRSSVSSLGDRRCRGDVTVSTTVMATGGVPIAAWTNTQVLQRATAPAPSITDVTPTADGTVTRSSRRTSSLGNASWPGTVTSTTDGARLR